MRIIRNIFLFILLLFISVNAQSERTVLIEVLTNSHCPLCPPAHNAIQNHLSSTENPQNFVLIYYHMSYPYSDDQLYQANKNDPGVRNNYYGPFGSTPVGIFEGDVQNSDYSNWSSRLESIQESEASFDISLSGTTDEGENIMITADIEKTGSASVSDLVLHFVVVEDVNYSGRNGISSHKNVMRKMYPSAEGMEVSVSGSQQFEQSITIDENWVKSNLSIVVFLQSKSSKVVYQAAEIEYGFLVTDVREHESQIPSDFILSQNYPNPFNPSTKIKFGIPSENISSSVSLKVYDILGNEVATVIDNEQFSPGTYEADFNADGLSSGVYFYQLKSGKFKQMKKMILMR